MSFLAGVRMCVCACVRVCVCVRFSTFETPITHKFMSLRYQYEIWYASEAITTLQSWLFSWQLMPDLWFYEILTFLKKGRGSSKFRKIWATVLKLHTNILHLSRNFRIEFGQNRLKHSNFFRFWIFWEFFQNCLTQANSDLSSWNFVGKCTNTKWCLISNFIRIGGDL